MPRPKPRSTTACRRTASLLMLLAVLALPGFPVPTLLATEPAELALVKSGHSAHRIWIAPEAPRSVQLAARELRDYLQRSTGARLPVVTSNSPIDGPYISLGETPATRALKWDAQDIPLDGFHISTHAGHLFIFGRDEQEPEGQRHLDGISKGTLFGTYTFLEDHLDIRWLFPGPAGEDVPRHTDLHLPAIDRAFAPPMVYRIIEGIDQHRTDVASTHWKLRNRHGFARRFEHRHNWQNVLPAAWHATHPQWFAEFEGRRLPPTGHYKLETTNPQLIHHVAEQAIAAFDQDPVRFSFSLSPTDGQGWSQSAESRALDDVAPDGQFSASRRVITFYNQVARQVGQKHPDRLLGGYLYDRYFFPPSDGVPPIEENLFLMLAPLQNYGFRLFRPDIREPFDAAFDAWTQAATHWGYYDLPVTLLPNGVSLITPPGLEILQHLYQRLSERGAQAIYISGNPAFGFGGVLNYVLAKLNWDPSQDPYQLAEEFYHRAYGPHAGPLMQDLYTWWEGVFAQHYRADPHASYHVTEALVERLFAPHYAELEARFLAAQAAATQPQHRERLDWFAANLSVMQWLLRSRGLIAAERSSPLWLDQQAIGDLLNSDQTRMALSPLKTTAAMLRVQEPAVRVERVAAPAAATPLQPFLLRGPSRWLLSPEPGQRPQILCTRMPIEEIVTYRLYDAEGTTLAEGVLTEGEPIPFDPPAAALYWLDLTANRAAYALRIDHCAHALKADGRFRQKLWFHAVASTFPTLYLFPESSDAPFQMTLSSLSTRETVAATLHTPGGAPRAQFDTSDAPLQQRAVPPATTDSAASGAWALRFEPPRQGHARYAFFEPQGNLSPWIGVDPNQLIRIHTEVPTPAEP